MNDTFAISTINLPARLLGALLYYPPDTKTFTSLMIALDEIESLFNWRAPNVIIEQRNIMIAHQQDPELTYQYSVLFEGQGFMPAPPWGSVYLDKENLLLGESTQRYRYFLQHNNIVLQTGINEPEDQIGLMLMTMALLIESQNVIAAKTLLSDHLMIWAPRYLAVLAENEISPFYHALALITDHFLAQVVDELQLKVPFYHLYR